MARGNVERHNSKEKAAETITKELATEAEEDDGERREIAAHAAAAKAFVKASLATDADGRVHVQTLCTGEVRRSSGPERL